MTTKHNPNSRSGSTVPWAGHGGQQTLDVSTLERPTPTRPVLRGDVELIGLPPVASPQTGFDRAAVDTLGKTDTEGGTPD